MDSYAKSELASIKSELRSIISELESISSGVRNDFTGIGNDKCADCINKVISQYYYVKSKLDNLDTTTVTESYAKAHSSGGGRHR